MLSGGHRVCHFAGGRWICDRPCSAPAEPASNAGRATDGPDSQDHEGGRPVRRPCSALRSPQTQPMMVLGLEVNPFSRKNKKIYLNPRRGGRLAQITEFVHGVVQGFSTGEAGGKPGRVVHALVVWATLWATRWANGWWGAEG